MHQVKSLFHFFHFLTQRKLRHFKNRSYTHWLRAHESRSSKRREQLLAHLSELSPASSPSLSILLPVCNPPLSFLQATIASLQAQLWTHWELCLVDDASGERKILDYLRDLQTKEPRLKLSFHEQRQGIASTTNDALALASGEFVAFLDHDDLLAPEALGEIILSIKKNPEVSFLYTDEDKIDQYGHRSDPFFKPDWNPDLLRSLNYCSHFSVLRRSLVIKLGGLDAGVEGAQDWDLLLRATENLLPHEIIHLPSILYHWRISAHSTAYSIATKPYVTQASRSVLERHLIRKKCSFSKIENVHPGGHWRVHYRLPHRAPYVSIIIPNRNQKKLLQTCLESIEKQTIYPHYEIIIADNDSQELDLLAYYEEQITRKKIRLLQMPGAFNYASMNNRAVDQAHGEILLLLNNDIEVLNSSWLHEMVSHAIRPEIGAVGALLYYPDGRIQHAGVILGIAGPMKVKGVAGHSGKFFSPKKSVAGNRLAVVQNFSAVTGAALAVRKKLYEDVGGMNEKDLPVSFNDIDFCLKLRDAGYWNLWTPFAKLLHHESKTRGSDRTPAQKKRAKREIAYMRERWGSLLDRDPAYNPNLTLEHEDWSLAWPPREDSYFSIKA